MIDLRTCKPGDILISSHGAKLEYVGPTPSDGFNYLDHVVKYLDGEYKNSFGTRTDDGYVFRYNRKPEIDHDIVEIIRQRDEDYDLLSIDKSL